MFAAIALSIASAAPAEQATILYVECVESEATRLAPSDMPEAGAADTAVANCESLVAGAGQESVDQAPPEMLRKYREAGLTPEQILEIGKRISRDSAREVVAHVLNKLRK